MRLGRSRGRVQQSEIKKHTICNTSIRRLSRTVEIDGACKKESYERHSGGEVGGTRNSERKTSDMSAKGTTTTKH